MKKLKVPMLDFHR